MVFLELVDCNLTALSCEFLGHLLGPHGNKFLTHLKLDHNDLGSEGVQLLAKGLRMNSTLTNLSLNFCKIE